MNITKLSEIMRNAGVAGAGGAGFPSYAKLNTAADTIILNCAECEPLLKLHRQVLEKYALDIMQALDEIAKAVEAKEVIIAIKASYKAAVTAVEAHLPEFTNMRIGILPEIYPAGDEVVTIYETTGRVVPPGSIPIAVGVTVFNVETVLNVANAISTNAPVTSKYITVAGEVKNPVTLKAPLGITYGELIELAGGATVADPVIIAGGPMTGRISSASDVVTKTSNAILVMPQNQYIVQKRLTPVNLSLKRAMSACCQCSMCTDLCSRNLLGHPIKPNEFMRVISSGVTSDPTHYINGFFCSGCGLCTMYSCFQGLNPSALIGEAKMALRKNGVQIPKGVEAKPIKDTREFRLVPMSKLTARLGLTKYNKQAPLVDELVNADSVKIMLSQSIGAPAVSCVKVGDAVKVGDVVGGYDAEKLGVAVHSSIDGVVAEVTDKYVRIKRA